MNDRLQEMQGIAAIGTMTSGIVHNFNNLLGVVILNLELLQEQVARDSEPARLSREALETARRGAELTRRLLALAHHQPLRPQRTDVNRAIEAVAGVLRATLGKDIELALDLADRVWPVMVDPTQLEASLINLLLNSRQAMTRGGHIAVTTANRRHNGESAAREPRLAGGDYVLVEVSDTGSGIPPSVLDHIFEPFFTTKSNGTGLGLSTVSSFVDRTGGAIDVSSEVGVGTTLRLYLPRADAGKACPGEVPGRCARGSAAEG